MLVISIIFVGCGDKKVNNPSGSSDTPTKLSQSNNQSKNNTSTDTSKEVITVTNQSYSPDSRIKVSYPNISGMKDQQLQEQINESIKGFALKEVLEMEKPKYYPKLTAYDLNYVMTLNNSNIISIEYKGYRDHEGVAHPSNILLAYNLDLKSNVQYKLDDLFKKKMNYRTGLTEAIKASESYQKYYEQFPNSLDSVLSSKISMFTVSDKSLKLYYEVAHVLGDYLEFEIPYDQLMDLIDTENQIWKAISTK